MSYISFLHRIALLATGDGLLSDPPQADRQHPVHPVNPVKKLLLINALYREHLQQLFTHTKQRRAPFIEGWANSIGIRVGFRTYHDSGDLKHWLTKFKEAKSNPHICYIAGHGVGKRLHGSIGPNINLKLALEDVFPRRRGPKPKLGEKGILIGACEVGEKDHFQEIIMTTGYPLSWIAGYEQSVPWMEATICELLFLTYKLTGRCKRIEKNNVVNLSLDSTTTQSAKKACRWVCDDFPMSADFGFRGIDRK